MCIRDRLKADTLEGRLIKFADRIAYINHDSCLLYTSSILSSGLNSILGVPYSLYGESWIGKDNYDFSVVDKQIDLFIKCAPEGYFALMFQLDTRKWYIEEENCPDSFTSLSQISGNSKWRHAAAEYMKAIIRHVEEKYLSLIHI